MRRNLRHQCDRDGCYADGLPNWGMLEGCFGATRIRPSDIDGVVDRNGQFLVLESKRVGAEVRQGQHILFQSLAATGLFTILVFFGDSVKCEVNSIRSYSPGVGYQHDAPCDLDGLRRRVAAWFAAADSRREAA